MNILITLVSSLILQLYPLLLLFFLATIFIFLLTYNRKLGTLLKKKSFRLYINTIYGLIALDILIAITIIYWLIDTQLFPLNIPAQPYIFFVLIITILFGARIGLLASLISTWLIVYYLYDPRYQFSIAMHIDNVTLTLFTLGISVYIGNILRDYQRRLVYESDQLKALIKARDQFTSVAAHDLRTPLTVIKLYLQSMLRSNHKTSKEAKKSLTYIDHETDKVIELINSLFDFSRIESSKMIINKKNIDIVILCRSTVKKVSKIYKSHTFIFSTKIPHLKL